MKVFLSHAILFLLMLFMVGCGGNGVEGETEGVKRGAFGPTEEGPTLLTVNVSGSYRYVDRWGAKIVFDLDNGVIVNGSIYGETGAYEGIVTGGVRGGLILFTITSTTGARRGTSCSYRAAFGSVLDTVYVGNGSVKDICGSNCGYQWRQQ